MQLVVLVCLTDRKYKLHALISFVREASDQYLDVGGRSRFVLFDNSTSD